MKLSFIFISILFTSQFCISQDLDSNKFSHAAYLGASFPLKDLHIYSEGSDLYLNSNTGVQLNYIFSFNFKEKWSLRSGIHLTTLDMRIHTTGNFLIGTTDQYFVSGNRPFVRYEGQIYSVTLGLAYKYNRMNFGIGPFVEFGFSGSEIYHSASQKVKLKDSNYFESRDLQLKSNADPMPMFTAGFEARQVVWRRKRVIWAALLNTALMGSRVGLEMTENSTDWLGNRLINRDTNSNSTWLSLNVTVGIQLIL